MYWLCNDGSLTTEICDPFRLEKLRLMLLAQYMGILFSWPIDDANFKIPFSQYGIVMWSWDLHLVKNGPKKITGHGIFHDSFLWCSFWVFFGDCLAFRCPMWMLLLGYHWVCLHTCWRTCCWCIHYQCSCSWNGQTVTRYVIIRWGGGGGAVLRLHYSDQWWCETCCSIVYWESILRTVVVYWFFVVYYTESW